MNFKFNSFFLLTFAAATLPSAAATNLHHPDTNPKLKVYTGDDTAGIRNWGGALRFCRIQDGRSIATPEEVCALDDLQALPGEHWIPVRTPKQRNVWVRVGGGNPCQLYKDLHDSELQGREWSQPSWGRDRDNGPLPFDNLKVLCASVPEAPPLPQTCASVWGDPHIITFDGLRFDAQGDADFVLAQSMDSALDVQGRFVQTTKVSVMRGFHAWTGRDDEPHVEINFKDDTCHLETYVDGNPVDLDQQYVAYGTYAAKSTGVHFIKRASQNRWLYYPGSGITFHYRFKRSERHGCQFTFQVCLPGDLNERLIGLFGSPNGDKRDDWMTPEGKTLEVPTERNDLRFGKAFEYSHQHYCIRDPTKNKFLVPRDYSCDVAYDTSLEEAVKKVSPEVKAMCGDDLECLIEGTTFEEEDGSADGTEDSMEAIVEERMLESPEEAEVTEDTEFEAEQPQEEEDFVSGSPSLSPSRTPTNSPTGTASQSPTRSPTHSPTGSPSSSPTSRPSSDHPSASPTSPALTTSPTTSPSASPTTAVPTASPTSSPTAAPTEAPTSPPVNVRSATEVPASKTPTPTTNKGSGSGDPHFKTWTGDKFDYHGECDLVLVDNPTFANGKGMHLHIRTTRVKYFSYIERIALQIGDDVLEFGNDVDTFLINGQQVAPNRKHHKTYLAGYLVRRDTKAISVRLNGKHGRGKIDFHTRKNGFPAVIVDGGDTDMFRGSLGLLGEWSSGKQLARDGETEMNEDSTAFALEWQVRDTEPMLFQESRFPQFPAQCMPPQQMPGNRLGSELMKKEAEKACAHWKEDKEDCIFDVIATRDILVAAEGRIVHVD